MAADYTLDDFRKQLGVLQRRGRQAQLRQVPGLAEMVPAGEDPDEAVRRIAAMIDAMTPEERRDPTRIDAAARSRIAAASGTQPSDVERFLAQFAQVLELMRYMAGLSFWQRLKLVLGFGRLPKPGDS